MITRRPATDRDAAFAQRVERAAVEAALSALPEAVRQPLVDVQLRAREAAWRARWPEHVVELVLDDERPVGVLRLHAADDHLVVIDLVVDVDARGRGIGSAALKAVHARASGRPVHAHVLHDHPARALYRRLGFVEVGQHGPHVALRWG